MRIRLPTRVPLRLRVFFRGTFLLLALATIALAMSVLVEEKRVGARNHDALLRKSQAQIVARLSHPTGQLALLNPAAGRREALPLKPLVLPFSGIDFNDRAKVQQAVEMAGCGVQYDSGANMCVAVGNNPYAGGFVYVVGSFASGALTPHFSGELDLTLAHRALVEVRLPERTYRWIAPFELTADANLPSAGGVRGRLTGYDADVPVTHGSRPIRDFRGWLWQEGRCIGSGEDAAASDCPRRSFVSIRLPVEPLREALFGSGSGKLVWPPPSLEQMAVRLQMLAPGDADASALFDSDVGPAHSPFTLADLTPLLLPGETLTLRPLDAHEQPGPPIATLTGATQAQHDVAPWLDRLIRHLPVQGADTPIPPLQDVIATPTGRYALTLTGDVRAVNRSLAEVTTRIAWFVAAMLIAIVLTWLAIEIRIIRRITLLTRGAARVAMGVRGQLDLEAIDVPDLRGSSDELGLLARALKELLQRVNDDVKRERIRAEQEKDTWHAVGHEIMSPLQSLMVLHGSADDPSRRYISRMQQAVKVLYGSASPSEAFEATTLTPEPLDLEAFLADVAANAAFIGVHDVRFSGTGAPLWVRADAHPLEDVVSHVLRNADRHRATATPICITLRAGASAGEAVFDIDNDGEPIDPSLLERIFEYGVSGDAAAPESGHRGQGLFVARTYMAKMGGTISAMNMAGGVRLRLALPVGSAPNAARGGAAVVP